MEKIFGSYEILSKLGEGAQGAVYKARDAQGRVVALKFLHESLAGDPQVAGRFQRESRIALAVDHRNVVRALDAGRIDKKLFLAYEFVAGGSLSGLLEREAPLSEDRSLALFRDLVSALDAVHRAGLIHRDVKPANLLLDEDGILKLSDLGLARPTSDARTQFTRSGMIVGTPSFMAPEQIEPAGELDIRCDLYASGVVLFQCLTGCLPFGGATVLDILRAHLETPPPDPRSLNPSVRPEVARLVLLLLEKRPEDRPRTPAEVLERLAGLAPPASPCGTVPYAGTIDEAPVFPNTLDAAPSFPRTLDAPPAPAGPAAETLQPAPASASRGAARIKLVSRGPSGASTLFVYAGRRLRMGREGLDRCDSEVCLRLRPASGNEEAIRRISGRHLEITVEGGRALVADLGSSGGTRLDGKPLPPKAPRAVGGRVLVEVAGVLELSARLVLPPPGPPPAVRGIGAADGGSPAVLVERPSNGTEHAYALVPGRLGLAAAPEGLLAPGPEGSAELFAVEGGLWLKGGGLPAGQCLALEPGASFSVGPLRLEAEALRPEDQK